MIERGAVVVVYLAGPREKYWGRLLDLTTVGVFLRGIEISVLEDWGRQLAREEYPGLGLTEVFFPAARIEKIYRDESVGAVPSLHSTLCQLAGRSIDDLL